MYKSTGFILGTDFSNIAKPYFLTIFLMQADKHNLGFVVIILNSLFNFPIKSGKNVGTLVYGQIHSFIREGAVFPQHGFCFQGFLYGISSSSNMGSMQAHTFFSLSNLKWYKTLVLQTIEFKSFLSHRVIFMGYIYQYLYWHVVHG